jgi:hypothetical protein
MYRYCIAIVSLLYQKNTQWINSVNCYRFVKSSTIFRLILRHMGYRHTNSKAAPIRYWKVRAIFPFDREFCQ